MEDWFEQEKSAIKAVDWIEFFISVLSLALALRGIPISQEGGALASIRPLSTPQPKNL
jgi:hypothetical protein